MTIDIRHPDFISFCQTVDCFEVVNRMTGNNIRGLDKIAMSSLAARGQLPPGVKNMLLAYFFHEFANTVYHRNDLGRVYDYWAANNVKTIGQAEKMFDIDIYKVVKRG